MQITYSLIASDYLRLRARTMNRISQLRTMRVISGVSLLGMALYFAIRSPIAHGDWNLIIWLAGGLSVVLGSVIFGASRLAAIQAYLRRPGALAAHTLSLLPEGVLRESPGMATRLAWEDVTSLAEDHGYLEFSAASYASPIPAIVFFVPTRAFRSPDEAQAFLAEAQAYRSAAHPEASSLWMSMNDGSERRTAASYSLTMGELLWMGVQARQSAFLKTFLLPPLAGAMFFGFMWVQLGSLLTAALASCVFVAMLAVVTRLKFQSGAASTGGFSRPIADYRMTLSPTGFGLRSSSGLMNWYAWAVIARIDEKNRYFLFHAAQSVICIVPPTAFGSAPEAQAFLDTARMFHESALKGEPPPPAAEAQSWPPPPRR